MLTKKIKLKKHIVNILLFSCPPLVVTVWVTVNRKNCFSTVHSYEPVPFLCFRDREIEKTFEVVKHKSRAREGEGPGAVQHLQLDNQFAVLEDK